MNKVYYKYSIGDRVKLVKEPKWEDVVHGDDAPKFQDVKDREYVIDGIGWHIDKTGELSTYYTLNIDDYYIGKKAYLSCNNELSEDTLEVVSDYKGCEEDVPLVSIDGKELFVGMMVYAEVMQKWTGEPAKCNLNFVFASYGKIVRMHYHRTRWSRIGKVYVEHEFLCIGEDGHAFGDARRKGNVLEYSVNQILVDIPDDFAEQYVREVVNDKMSYDVLEPTCQNFYYEVSEWLKHIGVYYRVMELYADEKLRGAAPGFARMAEQRRKLQEELDNKLRNILARLSDTEKKRMKELLSIEDNNK